MAGLGLTNAVHSFQQGLAWRQQQDQMAEQKKREQAVREAGAAGFEVLNQAKAQHEASQAEALAAWERSKGTKDGFQAQPFKPNEQLYLQAFDARGSALARAGTWEDWMKNEAMAMPLRERVRQKTFGDALAKFDTDGDPVALAKAVYPVIYDGREITDVQVDKTGGLGFKGASGLAVAGKDIPQERYIFTLSDGTKLKPMTAEKLAERVKRAAMNPEEVRKYELQQRLIQARKDAEAEKERIKGDEDRKTEKEKHGYKLTEIREQNAGRQEVAETRADAQVKTAGIRASGGGGGGSGGGSGNSYRSKTVDSDGYVLLHFRDGSTKRAMVDGKPVRAGDWSKRVDKLASDLGKDPKSFKKTPEELRAQAEQMLAGTTPQGEASPPAAAPKPAGAPKAAPKFLGFE